MSPITGVGSRSKMLGVCLVTAILLALAGCAATTMHESTSDYVADAVVTTRVKAAIIKDPALKASEINVETCEGTVHLSGFVHDKQAIARAGEVARAVNGAIGVKNDIRLK